jgi:hypothetical protein
MTTGATTLLSLALPVEGELDGTWGNVVNYGITDYVDIAVAGTLTFSGDGAITLANTAGDASGTNIGSTTAQYAIIKVTGTLTTTKVITAPSSSRTYIVDNAATGGTVTFKASGQTGVSVAVGERCSVYYNGTDYVKVGVSTISFGSTGLTPATATSGAVSVAGTLAVANGGTGVTTSTGTGNTVLSASPTLTGTPLAPTASNGTNTTQIATTAFVQNQIGATGIVSSFSAGTTGFTPSTGTTGAVTLAGTLATANGGTGNVNGTVAKLATTNFSIEESGGKLIFKYGGTTIASMTSAGIFTTLSDVVAAGTP